MLDPMTELRPLARTDLPALRALQHEFAGEGPRWAPEQVERYFTDPAHDHGRRAVVAERAGAVVAAAGWVEAGDEFFGSPVLARDADAAGAVVDHLLARARALGARTIRISTTRVDQP